MPSTLRDGKAASLATLLITHPDAHPLVTDLWLLKAFGPEYVLWEPETLWQLLEKKVGHLGTVAKNRIQALRTIHVTTTPYQLWEVFLPVVMALNGTPPRFDVMQVPSVGQLLLGIDVMWSIRALEISDEVERYCASIFMGHGLHYAPPPLSRINKHFKTSSSEKLQVVGKMNGSHVLLPDSITDVQAAKLISARQYLKDANQRKITQLAALRKGA